MKRAITPALAAVLCSLTPGCKPGGTSAGAAGDPKPSAVEAVPVTVAAATSRSIARTVEVVGTLWGEEEIVVASKIDGRIARVLHDVGDAVAPGDVLLELEDTELKLQLAEARRGVEAELAKIGLEQVPEGALDVARIPTVARVAALEENARLKVERARTLSRDIVSEEDLEAREADYRVALAAHQAVAMEATATLAAAREKSALRDTIEQRLRETRILVPTPTLLDTPAGAPAREVELLVAERMVSTGEVVRESPPTPAFRLVINDVLKLRSPVPERYAAEIAVGQEIRLQVESHPGRTFAGAISRVSPAVDRASRTFPVEARVPNTDRTLKPGSFAKALIATGVENEALTVPEEALATFAGVTKVFVIAGGGEARAVEVKPGARVEVAVEGRRQSWYEVAASSVLQPGAPVATSGQTKLFDGARVRLREPEAAGAAGAAAQRTPAP